MNKYFLLLSFFLFIDCSGDLSEPDGSSPESSSDIAGQGAPGPDSGLVTAGEWNDLDNWAFWQNLITNTEFNHMPSVWGFYTNNRISVEIHRENVPIENLKIELKKEGNSIWTAKTDVYGKAELWVGLNEQVTLEDFTAYDLWVNETKIEADLSTGHVRVNLDMLLPEHTDVQIAFMVDATGSMGDELEFLKADLQDVIQQSEESNPCINISTASVFYRDEGDDYLVRKSPFSGNLLETISFINQQRAGGGGDFPEAVHTALSTSIQELEWSENAKARILFVLLDAPPHHEPQVIDDIQRSIQQASGLGIKVIPIVASGIDKPTEFLMRHFAIATNGTYVFITDHSGIGNDHLEPSVGQYEVEFLNELMIRLISEQAGCAVI